MKWLLGLFVLGISTAYCFKGKENVRIKFTAKFGSGNLQLEKNYFLAAVNDSISIERFKFYVSGISLLKNGKTVHQNKTGYYLLDLENKMQLEFGSTTKDFDAIQFNLGIDSITNSGGVKGGDLDPTKNMYWAWQSGYINFKLEGKSKVCKTRNNVFQYHIGGYMYPHNSLQRITIPVQGTNSVNIVFDLEKFLSGVGLQTTNEIMSPGDKAMQVAKLYKTVFEAQ
jgi:hypothetical protein